MIAGIITAVSGAIIGVGGFVFGIIKWKKEQKIAKEEREAKEKAERELKRKQQAEETILTGVAAIIAPIQEQNEGQSYAIEELRLQHQTETAKIQEVIDDNEKDRLRAEIMQFVCYLRNDMHITSAEFKHIHHVYDKYHEMGGNSYIDEDFEYIKEKEREYLQSLSNKE